MNIYDQFADYYDHDFGHDHEDVPFYREMARRTGGPVLEMMCGSGRLLIPLAHDGYAITGIDSSEGMLARARQRVINEDLTERVTLVHGDACTTCVAEHTFSLAFIAANSLMHVHQTRNQLALLAIIRRALLPGGICIVDLFHPDGQWLMEMNDRLILEHRFELDGHQILKFSTRTVDLAQQLLHITYLYDRVAPDGQVTRRIVPLTLRWFYRYELEHLFARAGFRVISCYGDYDLSDYLSGGERLIMLAVPEGTS